MDKLKECAVSFSELFNVEYCITAGKKDILIDLILFFKKEHFYHLLGLNKLSDIQKVRGNKNKVFDEILLGKITYADLSKSTFFSEIASRFEHFTYLEQIIDSEKVIIKYNKNKTKSRIEAKFIIHKNLNDGIIHFFVDFDDADKKYFGRSFFVRNDNFYIQDKPFKIISKIKYINGKPID